MRLFVLHRVEDETGISGTGDVAEGVQFSDGRCVMRWLTSTATTGFYDSISDLEEIHGHGGKTQVRWIDEGPIVELLHGPQVIPPSDRRPR